MIIIKREMNISEINNYDYNEKITDYTEIYEEHIIITKEFDFFSLYKINSYLVKYYLDVQLEFNNIEDICEISSIQINDTRYPINFILALNNKNIKNNILKLKYLFYMHNKSIGYYQKDIYSIIVYWDRYNKEQRKDKIKIKCKYIKNIKNINSDLHQLNNYVRYDLPEIINLATFCNSPFIICIEAIDIIESIKIDNYEQDELSIFELLNKTFIIYLKNNLDFNKYYRSLHGLTKLTKLKLTLNKYQNIELYYKN